MNFQPASCCRICLKTNLLMSVYIYSPTFLMRPIEMIEKLHIFKMHPDDNLPSLLCQSCLYRVLDAYNLQQLAEASERRLREYMSSTSGTCGTTPESTSTFCSPANTQIAMKNTNASTETLYGNICDMFERNIDVDGTTAVTADDVLNDVEIDVSSLTRSEANEDTLNEVLVAGNIEMGYEEKNQQGQNNGIEEQKQEGEKKRNNSRKKREQQSSKASKVMEQCLECGKQFHYTGYLEAHKRIHTGEKPFKCKHCVRTFTQSSNLLLHQRTHTGERRFQCEICARLFTTSSNLKAHKAIHIERRDHKCGQCARHFKTKRELQRHETVHLEVKEYECALCGKKFSKRSYWKTHLMVVHSGCRSYKCAQCAKVFGSRSNLVRHMRTHSGEKPFQCRHCPWKFTQSSALIRHLRTHFKSLPSDAGLKLIGDDAQKPVEITDHNAFHGAGSFSTIFHRIIGNPSVNVVEGIVDFSTGPNPPQQTPTSHTPSVY